MERDLITLKIPNKPSYVGVIRLTTSSIASQAGLNIEEIEDVKVAIAEACINAMGKSDNFDIEYELYIEKLVISVKNVSEEIDSKCEDSKERELGILIIKSLMDEVEFTSDGIKMIKQIEDGNK
ncbi:ATP-binding protein [Sporanaerobacter acetigenes]|uniref:Serine/threonine-protein kinase RsbW n=1 Tax=Sporanaerobacter acetigenes DSM 13106 TaxID=1123281 RepID=A0A1M5YU47_9FIRM|nr:ATP-binding protein [Sporanaerobacter acetigenes]SHI15566.1 serine/threonine-protein kinase RsbW [Sporanaerobacter acetigenes DSM 13106]